jgi:hypothetical protein
MSVIEALNDNIGAVPDDVVRAFVEDLVKLASGLPPEARARLMGFVHLAGNASATRAELEVASNGELILMLRHPLLR